MLPTPLLLLAAPPPSTSPSPPPPSTPPPPPSLPPFECGPIFASRNNTRVDLPKGHHSAPNNERPWCYNLNVNKLADDGLGCDDYYSMGGSGKVRLCVPDGTGDPASSDGKCDSTAFFYCP